MGETGLVLASFTWTEGPAQRPHGIPRSQNISLKALTKMSHTHIPSPVVQIQAHIGLVNSHL